MKRVWILVLAVSVGLNAGLLYVSLTRGGEGPRPGPGPGRPQPGGQFEDLIGEHLRRMTESLGLEEEQRVAIAALHEDLLPRIGEEHRSMEELRRAIADLYSGPEFDAAEFRALSKRLREAQAGLDTLVTEAMLGEAAVLTDDQRRKYAREMPWGRRGGERGPGRR